MPFNQIQNIFDMPVETVLQYLTVGGLITLFVVGSKLYTSLKKSISSETEYKSTIRRNEKEVERLHTRITNMKKDIDNQIKSLTLRVDTDKDAIIRKFEEMDNKFEGRFNKLTELIIDLFKDK